MASIDEPAIPLDEALAPHLERAAARKAEQGSSLEDRLSELITADEPAEGLDAFGRRLRDAWVAEIESGTSLVDGAR